MVKRRERFEDWGINFTLQNSLKFCNSYTFQVSKDLGKNIDKGDIITNMMKIT